MLSEKEITETSTDSQETQESYNGNANEQDNKESNSNMLIEKHDIIDENGAWTPFKAVRHEKEWMVTMGKYMLKSGLSCKDECEVYVRDKSWLLIMDVVAILAEGTLLAIGEEEVNNG